MKTIGEEKPPGPSRIVDNEHEHDRPVSPRRAAVSRTRAFSLLSGGLDSLLATRLVMEQGIDVVALHFITPFFGYQKKGQEERYQENWEAAVRDFRTDHRCER